MTKKTTTRKRPTLVYRGFRPFRQDTNGPVVMPGDIVDGKHALAPIRDGLAKRVDFEEMKDG